MSYPIDIQILRTAGDLLARGRGRFTLQDYQGLCRTATADQEVYPTEHAALLVVAAAVLNRCDDAAKAKLLALIDLIRQSDDAMEPWVVRAVSGTLLRRGAALVAGRGVKKKVTHEELKALIAQAAAEGPGGPGLSPDESRALLVLFEMMHGRMTPDAADLASRQTAIIAKSGVSIGAAVPGGGGGRTAPQPGSRQCGACAGTGTITCGSCGGRGSQSYSRTRQRYDGSVERYTENIDCSCSSGRLRCSPCGGTGRL